MQIDRSALIGLAQELIFNNGYRRRAEQTRGGFAKSRIGRDVPEIRIDEPGIENPLYAALCSEGCNRLACSSRPDIAIIRPAVYPAHRAESPFDLVITDQPLDDQKAICLKPRNLIMR
jgi:hypothetical protein